MSHPPLVSVLMPAYNCASFIGAAIESVLAQTYPHFELLIIDDGSTDETPAVAAAFCDRDPRVQIYPQPHAGRVAARNNALGLAQGEYFAWLDADDLARPHRLERQVVALQSNPRHVIVGSAYQAIDEHEVLQVNHKMPVTDTMIRWHGLFHSPFAQSSVMLRAEMCCRETWL
jgi:glycosyltransferase involved in cell wall biosynthesis